MSVTRNLAAAALVALTGGAGFVIGTTWQADQVESTARIAAAAQPAPVDASLVGAYMQASRDYVNGGCQTPTVEQAAAALALDALWRNHGGATPLTPAMCAKTTPAPTGEAS